MIFCYLLAILSTMKMILVKEMVTKHQGVLCHCWQNLLLKNHLNYFSLIFFAYFQLKLLLIYKLVKFFNPDLKIYFVSKIMNFIVENELKYKPKNFLILP